MSIPEQKFEESSGTRRTIFVVVAVVSLLLIAGIAYIARSPGKSDNGVQQLEGALRHGSPEFDKYIKEIAVDSPEATWGARAIGDIQMRLTTTVRNFTGRTISGLEIHAAVVDSQGAPVKERTVIVIPTRQAELEPNKTLDVAVVLEGIDKDSDRANIKMEVTGIKFK